MNNSLRPGDVVVTYSAWIGEWTGAQVLRETYQGKRVEVVELDWSSREEPQQLSDVGMLSALEDPRGRRELPRFAQLNVRPLLPRAFRVLGNTAPLDVPAGHILGYWNCGFLLDESRRQKRGMPRTPHWVECDLAALDDELSERTDADIVALHLDRIDEFDCTVLTRRFPRLTYLGLAGSPGQFRPYTGPENGVLRNASALNGLVHLETLAIQHLYGMAASDIPLPESLPRLGLLAVNGVPADFAHAARAAWRPVVKEGVELSVRKARSPEWIGENVGLLRES